MSLHPSYGVVPPEVFNKAANCLGFGETQHILRDADPHFFKDETGGPFSWWRAEIILNWAEHYEIDVKARSEAEVRHIIANEFADEKGPVWEQIDHISFVNGHPIESLEFFECWEALL